jgi:DNA repair protein RecO
LLTDQIGKVDVIAKGARKAGSRLAASTEPITRIRATLAAGQHRWFLTQVEPVTSYPRIRESLDRIEAAAALLEIARESLPYESPAEEVFQALDAGLSVLSNAEDWRPALTWALLRLMDVEGQAASWSRDVETGLPAGSNPGWVSPSAGGLVVAQTGDAYPVSVEALIGLDRTSELASPPAFLKRSAECLDALLRFWLCTLDARLPACEALARGLRAEADLG